MHATRKSARCWNGAISLTELSNSERNRPPRNLAIVFRGDWLRVGLGVHAIAAQGLNKCASLDTDLEHKTCRLYLSNESMPPEKVCRCKEVKRDTGDGGGTNTDATLVGVIKCAVELIVAT